MKRLTVKLEHVLFALALALGALLAVALMTPEPRGSHGALHPDHPSLLIGGSGAECTAPVLAPGGEVPPESQVKAYPSVCQ